MALLTAVDRRAIGLVLIFTYIFPIIIRTVTGLNYSPFSVVWTAGLLGAIAPDVVRTVWNVPPRFRAALVGWALTLVAGSLIVVLREFDFTWTTVWSTSVANSSTGGWPSFVVTWSLHTSLVLLSGILWFDWLCGLPPAAFKASVVLPLAASGAVMVAVALYQLFADVTFLNPTIYGALGRASGTVMDGNLCGTIAGLWIGGAALLVHSSRLPYRGALLGCSITACWLAVWASGSRTGLAAALIVSAYVAVAFARGRAIRASTVALAAAIVVVTVVGLSAANVVGPLQRVRQLVPTLDAGSLRALASELWNRNGYGAISTAMIGDFPVFGVGVGGFHAMQADFARLHGLPVGPPDNAQNWYRHQFAELGVAGSVGWLWWAVLFGAFLLRRASKEPPVYAARGMVVAFAAVSLVGMPGQEVPASITFWLAAFWYVFLLDSPRGTTEPIARREWLMLAVSAGIFAVGTAWFAATSLRVPVRAQRIGWPYSYGFYHPDSGAFGPGPGWAGRRAVWVFEPAAEWIAVIISADYRALRGSGFASATSGHVLTRPSNVQLRCNGQPLFDMRITTTAPVRKYVRVPPNYRWMLLESTVNGGVPLRDLGIDDDREVGVRIDWAPIEVPPTTEVSLCGSPAS